MDYMLMNDEDILRDLAERVDKIRLSKKIKESEIEEFSGISRKTLYNFKQGATGLSLKNFIRLLKALNEVNRLQQLFPEDDSYSPRKTAGSETARRVRDKKDTDTSFRWGDEK